MEQELVKLRSICARYKKRDTYNIDETALFWKKTPERSLATHSAPGLKVQKSRVTIAVCGNADGSDKVKKATSMLSRANVQYIRCPYG
jgi:hypothetical protein